jgi:hypothetical protein
MMLWKMYNLVTSGLKPKCRKPPEAYVVVIVFGVGQPDNPRLLSQSGLKKCAVAANGISNLMPFL